jgi:hypothetical protein
MIGLYLVIAAILLAIGVMIGVLVIFAAGIHREEKAYSLGQARPGRFASGVRTVTGAYADAAVAREVDNRSRELVAIGSVRYR